jgi:lysophospholipase L1-like esterase
MRRRGWGVFAVALTCLWAGSAYAQALKFNPPKGFIVGVGDSLVFGFQEVRFLANPDPSNFTDGFMDIFTSRARGTSPGKDVELANFGCPGETTASLLAGPCAYHAAGFGLHQNYSGAQIDAAVGFLETHRGQVGTIVVDIGSNDVLAVVDACGPGLNLACIAERLPAAVETLIANYEMILSRLRAAAPNAAIIVVQLYNPFVVIDPSTNVFALLINPRIAEVAADVRGRLADPFKVINDLTNQPATGCHFTQMCPQPPTPANPVDIHLSDAGYQLVADLIFDAADYARFEH